MSKIKLSQLALHFWTYLKTTSISQLFTVDSPGGGEALR